MFQSYILHKNKIDSKQYIKLNTYNEKSSQKLTTYLDKEIYTPYEKEFHEVSYKYEISYYLRNQLRRDRHFPRNLSNAFLKIW